MPSGGTVFLTGATGHVGKHLTAALLERGYRVRATTSQQPPTEGPVDWRRMDWRDDLDFDAHLDGCDAVLHLGAELMDPARMQRINVEATEALVTAAARRKVGFFGYMSSVSVYGSPTERVVREDSPVVPVSGDISRRYRTDAYVRAYAQTKLQGELVLKAASGIGRAVIVRPTVVRDLSNILEAGGWSTKQKIWRGYRRMHHVFASDVASAVIWLMERPSPAPGSAPEVYNISNDDAEDDSYFKLLAKAFALTGDSRFRSPFHAPGLLDLVKDMLKFRSADVRYPLGALVFPPDKLYSTGFRHPVGADSAQEQAMRLYADRRPSPPDSATG